MAYEAHPELLILTVVLIVAGYDALKWALRTLWRSRNQQGHDYGLLSRR